VVDRATRDRLIAEHPSSAEVLKPFLRGRDVKRWRLDYQDLYLIKIESSENREHPWTGKSETQAEQIFAQTYPAIHHHLTQYREALIKRCDQGKFFWELRSCIYWQEFERPKIIYPDIYEHQSFTIDLNGFFSSNTCYFISTDELWLSGLLNSQIVECFYKSISSSLGGNSLRGFSNYIKQIPIPSIGETDRKMIENLVQKCLDSQGQGVEQWEQEIDEIVARLYGLTEAERAIIAGRDNDRRV